MVGFLLGLGLTSCGLTAYYAHRGDYKVSEMYLITSLMALIGLNV